MPSLAACLTNAADVSRCERSSGRVGGILFYRDSYKYPVFETGSDNTPISSGKKTAGSRSLGRREGRRLR